MHDCFFIHHKAKAGKPTLVFIHGVMTNHTLWHSQIRYFRKKGYGIVAFDLPGHGRSLHLPFKKISVRNFAKFCLALLKLKKIKSPILIGHSLGGMIILRMVLLDKHYPKALILCNTSYKNPVHYFLPNVSKKNIRKTTSILVSILQRGKKYRPTKKNDFVAYNQFTNWPWWGLWLQGVRGTPWTVVLDSFSSALTHSNRRALKRISCPVLIIGGTWDTSIPISGVRDLHKNISHSSIVVLKRASHLAPFKNSAAVNKCIEQFLKHRLRR